MPPHASFPQQFFAVSSPLPDHRVLLAGGRDTLGGSRSTYRASLACYDYAAGCVAWLFEKTGSYPFRAVAQAGGVGAALLPFNFVRRPKGLFRFDLETGEPLPPDCEVGGWKLESVDGSAGAFFFSWVQDESSRVRAVDPREGTFREKALPYHSTSAGKTIEHVIATGPDTFVAMFSLVKGRRVVYSVESWSLEAPAPRWERQTSLERMVRNDSVLLFWEFANPKLRVEIVSIESGEVEASFRTPLAEVRSIQPLDARSYAILSLSGVHILDAAAQTVSQLWAPAPGEFLDFGDLAVDAASGKLIVVTAGNNQRPGTRVIVLDL